MAQQYAFSTSNLAGLGPVFIPPTQGDLEEARLRRLMDTAKLFNLQQEPLQANRMFQLQQAQLEETKGYHAGELASRTRGQNIDMRGQDVQTRGQDIAAEEAKARLALESRGQDIQVRGQDQTMQAHKEALRNATANNILSHAIARPDIPLSVYADTAKQFGFPELGTALATHHDEVQTEKAQQLGTALKAAASSGDTKTYGELLNTYRAMPDFNELAPKIKATVPEYAKDLDPTKPGVQTTAPLATNEPDVIAAVALQQQQNQFLQEKRLKDKAENQRYVVRRALGLEKVPTLPGYLH